MFVYEYVLNVLFFISTLTLFFSLFSAWSFLHYRFEFKQKFKKTLEHSDRDAVFENEMVCLVYLCAPCCCIRHVRQLVWQPVVADDVLLQRHHRRHHHRCRCPVESKIPELSLCHALRPDALSVAECRPRVWCCLDWKWPLVLLRAYWICCSGRKRWSNYKIAITWLILLRQDSAYLTNATPLGLPVSLSRSIFFCTMLPYLPNMISSWSSVMVLVKLVTYKLVSLIDSPPGRA